jgi:hypothetical protein
MRTPWKTNQCWIDYGPFKLAFEGCPLLMKPKPHVDEALSMLICKSDRGLRLRHSDSLLKKCHVKIKREIDTTSVLDLSYNAS